MGRVVQLPCRVLEPFRLDGEADKAAGRPTKRLVGHALELETIRRHRNISDSDELRQLEALCLQRMAADKASVEALSETFSAAEYLAPQILSDVSMGARGVLVVLNETAQRGVAYRCTSQGAVLVANDLVILPMRLISSLASRLRR